MILLISIAFLAVASIQLSARDKAAVALFGALIAIHHLGTDWLFHAYGKCDITQSGYYISAVAANFLCAGILARSRTITTVIMIVVVSCASCGILNIIGFILWWAYMPPKAYNIAFLLAYFVMLTSLTLEAVRHGRYRYSNSCALVSTRNI